MARRKGPLGNDANRPEAGCQRFFGRVKTIDPECLPTR